MNEDYHYYSGGYNISDDPYAMPNGVLINQLGITDIATLNKREAELSGLALKYLLSLPPPEQFNTVHLQTLHREIFCEVYPWAGQWRQVDIAKGDTHFLPHTQIQTELDALFTDVQSWGITPDSTRETFSAKAGELLLRLNYIHPFREGNGRTQRLFLQQWANSIDKSLNWASVGNDAMRNACIAGLAGNTRDMVKLILLNTK